MDPNWTSMFGRQARMRAHSLTLKLLKPAHFSYCNLVIEATIFDQIEHIFDSCLTSFGPFVFHDAMMMRCSWINVLPSKSNGLGRQLITFPGMRHSWPICWSFPVEPGVELFLGLPYDVAETNFIDTDTS